MTISLSAASSIDERTAVRRDAQRRRRANRKPKVDELEIESLRSLRSTRGISQLELARELGISASYLSQIETGKKPASNKLRRRMSVWAATSAVDRN
jgi:ribosome-binding protein aMBF1 (putative translation factor)